MAYLTFIQLKSLFFPVSELSVVMIPNPHEVLESYDLESISESTNCHTPNVPKSMQTIS